MLDYCCILTGALIRRICHIHVLRKIKEEGDEKWGVQAFEHRAEETELLRECKFCVCWGVCWGCVCFWGGVGGRGADHMRKQSRRGPGTVPIYSWCGGVAQQHAVDRATG